MGVVGCGQWGPNLIRAFRSLPESTVTVACDVDPARVDRVRSLHPGVRGETRFERMLENPGVDAVVVATPPGEHFTLAKAGLLAGKHTLVEMPMATSSAECLELTDIARAKGLVLMVGHTLLYSEPVRKLREIVDSNEIGDIRYIAAQRLNTGAPEAGVNVAWDLAAHDVSIVLHLIREMPHSVVCRGARHETPGTEGATSMSLYFANKREAIIRSSWHDSRKVRDMTIIGSRRMLVYDDISVQEKVKILGARASRPKAEGASQESLYSYSCGVIQLPDIEEDEPLKTQCGHFLESIRTGAAPLTGGATGLEVVRVLEASSESLRLEGATVTLGTGSRPRAGVSPGSAPFHSGAGSIHASIVT